MMLRITPLCGVIGLLCCVWPAVQLWASSISAFLDRDTMLVRDTVTLTIEMDASAGDADIDLEPLKDDFAILSTQVNTELQLLQNQQSAKTRWRIELQPKRSGQLQVPPIRVGSEQTAALPLTVQAQSSASAQVQSKSADDLFIEVQAEPANPYVQSQIRLTVRLFSALMLREGGLAGPSIPNAVVEKLGDDVSYETTRAGRRYQVFERRYAIFPQQSGTLKIPALKFQGWVASNNDRSFFPANRRRQVALNSDPVELTVRPRPADFNGAYWLPSAELQLHAGWSNDPPKFQVGEPITRTITLEAKGLGASQLPELSLPKISWARSYADQPVKEDRIEGAWRVGRREQRVALVPTEAGRFTLPEVRLDWWDTQKDQARTSILPAVYIEVLPAPGQPPALPAQTLAQEATTNSASSAIAVRTSNNAGVWPWLAGVLLLAWLVTLWAWWQAKAKKLSTEQVPAGDGLPTIRSAKRALQVACEHNDAPGAGKALLAWARALWPKQPPGSLGALALRLQPYQRTLVMSLDHALYAPNASPWRGDTLWQAVKQGLSQEQTEVERPQNSLTPLYPQRS